MVEEFLQTQWGQLVALWVACSTVTAGIWKLCERVEKVASEHAKRTTADWLRNADIGRPVSQLVQSFANWFDSIFGHKHLSWTCFWRSSLASLVFVCVIAGLVVVTGQRFGLIGISPLLILVVGMTSNIMPDYLSLLKSRRILQAMSHSSRVGIVGWLLVDIGVSFLIGVISVAFVINGGTPSFRNIRLIGIGALLARDDSMAGAVPNIFVYSTLMTSIWSVLYALAASVLTLNRTKTLLVKWIDIDKAPFQAIGVVMILIVSVCGLAMVPMVLLF